MCVRPKREDGEARSSLRDKIEFNYNSTNSNALKKLRPTWNGIWNETGEQSNGRNI